MKMKVPSGWVSALKVVAIGKAAVAGAGLSLAVLGALNVADAITASHWLSNFQHHYLNEYAAAGGVAGGVARVVFDRIA